MVVETQTFKIGCLEDFKKELDDKLGIDYEVNETGYDWNDDSNDEPSEFNITIFEIEDDGEMNILRAIEEKFKKHLSNNLTSKASPEKQVDPTDIHREAIKLGLEMDNYTNNLYLYVNDTTKKLVENLSPSLVSTFKSNKDGRLMYEILFAYDEKLMIETMEKGLYKRVVQDEYNSFVKIEPEEKSKKLNLKKNQ